MDDWISLTMKKFDYEQLQQTEASIKQSAFYQEMRRKFQAPGKFAMDYVIAHDVGRHI
ncbi:MAG: hypothetical protein EOM03_19065 [Clostridia bacterium]|nr:hypothetical protein [Clostridia bacterium]